MRPALILTALALAGFTASGAHAASYTFKTFDAAGSSPGMTFATGINNAGQVTGYYEAGSYFGNSFLETNGVFKNLAVPGSVGATIATGINNLGQVTGVYSVPGSDPEFPIQRYFVYSNGTYAGFDVPAGRGQFVVGGSINDAGQVTGTYETGYYLDAGTINLTHFNGFVETNGNFALVDVPAAHSPNYGSSVIYANGINDAGQVAGYYFTFNPFSEQSFVDTNGVLTLINGPSGSYDTNAEGINNLGQVVGSYSTSNTQEHGFVDTNGVLASLDVPGAASTFANGINDAGQVVGTFYDSAGGTHGFVATPVNAVAVPEPASAALLALGLCSLGLVKRRRNRQPVRG